MEILMTYITTKDGVKIYVEQTGSGEPILFMHEFGGHYLSWEPQVRYFSRRYNCISYAARGWPPSDVPHQVAAYSQARAADDAADVLDGLGLAKAHLVGLSMGATAAIEFAIRHPGRALSLTVAAGGGGGSPDPIEKQKFEADCNAFAAKIQKDGMAAAAELYCGGPARVQFRDKDPRGWAEFKQQFAEGSARGHALTMIGVQGAREPFFARTPELEAIQDPMLVIVGDEDDSTLGLALHLKRHVPRCGALMVPKTGHTINLEEPALFNRAVEDFIHAVERGSWHERNRSGGQGFSLIPREKS
jgi:pimeloyl-ACP methyl ester carboxylesterase